MNFEPDLDVVWNFTTALLIGALIGIEREYRGKPAGMRTNMLMCTGTCLLMILSIEVFRNYKGTMGDPGRIASQVMTGIGFIGAGTIIRSGEGILVGLTTASSIWAIAAIGMVAGSGLYILAAVGTAVMLIALRIFKRFE